MNTDLIEKLEERARSTDRRRADMLIKAAEHHNSGNEAMKTVCELSAEVQAEELPLLRSTITALQQAQEDTRRAVDALGWALDLLDMYDRRLVELGQPAELVYSEVHVNGKIRAKKTLSALEAACSAATTPAREEGEG